MKISKAHHSHILFLSEPLNLGLLYLKKQLYTRTSGVYICPERQVGSLKSHGGPIYTVGNNK